MLKIVIGVYDILWERDMRRRRIEGLPYIHGRALLF